MPYKKKIPDNTPAISVKQPWASMIMSGEKTIEVRNWNPSYRGNLWIHASSNLDLPAFAYYAKKTPGYARGALLGLVDLIDIVPFDEAMWKQEQPKHLNLCQFREGFCGWQLINPRRLRFPIKRKGTLGLWYPGKLWAEFEHQRGNRW